MQGSEKAVVARHEAGHAVVGTAVANLLPGQPRVEVPHRNVLIEIFLVSAFLLFVLLSNWKILNTGCLKYCITNSMVVLGLLGS